jgi:hypothetical protein
MAFFVEMNDRGLVDVSHFHGRYECSYGLFWIHVRFNLQFLECIDSLPLCRTFRGTHGDLLLLKCSAMSFERMGHRLGNVVRIHVAHWFEGSSVF